MLIILNTGDVVSKDTEITQISSAGAKQKSTTGDLNKTLRAETQIGE